MIREIVQMSYLIIVANISLFLFLTFNSTVSNKIKNLFLIGTAISLVMLICNIIAYTFQGTGECLTLLKINSAVSYSVSGPIILPFIYISGVISKKIRITLLILAGINCIVCIISIFNDCVFSFDEMGNSSLKTFAAIPFIFSMIYLCVLLSASFIKFRLGLRLESIFLTVLSIAILSATCLNTYLHFKYLISGMATLSCIFYYLFFTTQTLTRDAMTSALNRHCFYRDIMTMRKHQMFVISMDLNGLKQINDNLGHDEGDKAILAVSESTFEIIPSRCRFYRMGGDEFEILFPSASRSDTEIMMQKIKEAVHSRGYSIAMGCGEYKKGMDLDELIKEIDAMMYEDKARMKALQGL
ncbi:diguanylate cyclase (GGDEF) domain-containing protein [Ruminococcus flavefaciens]|uniref:Diguanylate cyclase (GGDEF) domain-containing protein n=1 Tax=Ruminococcus flavefaciens TaxID=1265 RepID=A0A1H6HUD3_RUMFL|nr:GGDEF domain-containing protein [Ruminococcus flavefaciens]SEH39192.1 diguanylate cyclase (GGDEF) domain-containing protein [Ruminococcus flavefaciens]